MKEKIKGIAGFIVILFILSAMVSAIVEGLSSVGQDDPQQQEEVVQAEEPTKDENDLITNYMGITRQISNEFIANYDMSWSEDDWDFAELGEGKVAVNTKYTFDNSSLKEPVWCIFTYREEPDGIRFDAHYFSVGDRVFYNDGTVDSILNGGGE